MNEKTHPFFLKNRSYMLLICNSAFSNGSEYTEITFQIGQLDDNKAEVLIDLDSGPIDVPPSWLLPQSFICRLIDLIIT